MSEVTLNKHVSELEPKAPGPIKPTKRTLSFDRVRSRSKSEDQNGASSGVPIRRASSFDKLRRRTNNEPREKPGVRDGINYKAGGPSNLQRVNKFFFSESLKKDWREVFMELDNDPRDGHLSVDELHVAVNKIVANASGGMDCPPLSKEDVAFMVAKYDTDGDNRLNVQEFYELIKTVGRIGSTLADSKQDLSSKLDAALRETDAALQEKAKLVARNALLEGSERELKAEIEQLQLKLRDLAPLQEKVDTLTQMSGLLTESNEMFKERNGKLNIEKDAMEVELERFKKLQSQMEQEAKSLQQAKEQFELDMQQERELIKAQKMAWSEQAKKYEEDKASMLAEIAQLKEDTDELDKAYEELEAENAELAAFKESHDKQAAILQQLHGEVKGHL